MIRKWHNIKKWIHRRIYKYGDIVSYVNVVGKVTRSRNKDYQDLDKRVLGVCTKILNDDTIVVADHGILDANVEGIICIGDRLTIGDTPGRMVAIKYEEDNQIYDFRNVGKVIALYNDYSKAKILLDIE